MKLYDQKYLRSVALPLLKKFSFDAKMQHHWVPNTKFKLNTFKHKGYWYHGKSREHETMMIFRNLIKENNVVVEVGGHIGYISIFFSHLVGVNGRVIVFEPGTNNLPYITDNIKNKYIKTNTQSFEKSLEGRETFTSTNPMEKSFVKLFLGLSFHRCM
jgi:predicted O-methyltransferase YrrM